MVVLSGLSRMTLYPTPKMRFLPGMDALQNFCQGLDEGVGTETISGTRDGLWRELAVGIGVCVMPDDGCRTPACKMDE
jgi:hypothetical protein